MKYCPQCKQTKALSEFHKHKQGKDGVRPICKECRKAEPYNPQTQLNRYLKSTYNITLQQYDEMLLEQDSVCAICGSDDPGHYGRFSVDHNHETNEVRGLLCNQCNVGLGALQDSPDILLKAAQYLLDKGNYGKSHV
jgi:hypothetical protein